MTDSDVLTRFLIKGQYVQSHRHGLFISSPVFLLGVGPNAWGEKGLAVWDKCLALIWTGRGGNALRNDAAPRFIPSSLCVIWHLPRFLFPSINPRIDR